MRHPDSQASLLYSNSFRDIKTWSESPLPTHKHILLLQIIVPEKKTHTNTHTHSLSPRYQHPPSITNWPTMNGAVILPPLSPHIPPFFSPSSILPPSLCFLEERKEVHGWVCEPSFFFSFSSLSVLLFSFSFCFSASQRGEFGGGGPLM